MRRLVVLFLLIVLPLQLSWAAASPACQHETGDAARHFGHHVHTHKAAKAAEQGQKQAGSLQSDQDCPACHLDAPTPLPPAVAVVLHDRAPSALPRERHDPGPPWAGEPPERPDWYSPA